MDNKEIMTLGETADYLKIAEKTVLRMVHKGRIPCAKVGGQWRFMRTVIEDWLISRMKVVPGNDLARLIEAGAELVPLSRLIREDFLVMDIKPGSKEEVLQQLILPLVHKGIIRDDGSFLEKLLSREKMASTAIGRGAAIPHLRNPWENPEGGPVLVVGICPEGTDFDAPDEEKINLFFLLCTDSEVVHLRAMAKLTAILRREDLASCLVRAKGKEEIINIILREEQKERMR